MFKNLTTRFIIILIVSLLSIILSLPTFFPNSSLSSLLTEKKVNLGLDLQGGSSILLEIDTKQYDKDQLSIIGDDLASRMRREGIKFAAFQTIHSSSATGYKFKLGSDQKDFKPRLTKILNSYFETDYSTSFRNKTADASVVEIFIEPAFFKRMHSGLMDQTLEIMNRRVNESGLKEIDIQRQGDSKVLMQAPGSDNPEEIKRILGKTAKLSLHLVNESHSANDALRGKLPSTLRLLASEQSDDYIVVEKKPQLTGEMLVNAQVSLNNNTPVVVFTLNSVGSKKFAAVSAQNIGSRLAIVLDDKVISAPVIREAIPSGQGNISGNFSIASANELAVLLRAGALPAPLKIIEERSVGPSLGQDSIKAGALSMLFGIIMIIIIIIALYRFFGALALAALTLNIFILISMLALTGAALTLPGIAGIVLTLGIAIDANVLIIERIREEYRKNGRTLNALEKGFSMSFATILDANVTTIFSAVILFMFGTGPIKGFAVTLIFGIISSMFSAIVFTKFLTAIWYRKFKPEKLNI